MFKFLLGIFITVVGFLIVWKSEWMLSNFGRIGFFDQHLGTEGGSRLGYKLIGMAALFIGVLIMTGLIDAFMGWILSPLLNLYR